jgi:excinuclease ABC subunit C
MAVRDFDRKFGAEFLESIPGFPGVYLVYNLKDELIYVGKAKNLKRRLSQYRNTARRKKHRRMRGIVKEAPVSRSSVQKPILTRASPRRS